MGMTDRKRVIKGLECCLSKKSCAECPYRECQEKTLCDHELMMDALELLKRQEAEYSDGITLLPCACGCTDIGWMTVRSFNKVYVTISCRKCGCSVTGASEEDAARLWNEPSRHGGGPT